MAFLAPVIGAAGGIASGLMSFFGGGPSLAQKNAQQQTVAMGNALQSNYLEQFGQYEDLAKELTTSLNEELLQGESGQGYTASELSALNTQALNATAANYKNAQIAAQTAGAARGGTSGLESGVQEQINASIASGAAGAESAAQLDIAKANAERAYQKQQAALAGLNALSGMEQKGAFTASGQEAEQNKIQEGENAQIFEENQAQNQALGSTIGAGLGALTGGLENLDTSGGSTFGEQVGNFFSGMGGSTTGGEGGSTAGFNALSVNPFANVPSPDLTAS